MRKSWPILVLAFAIALGVLPGHAQEAKPADPKPVEKAKKPKPEEALKRAMLRVKKVDDQKFMQMIVLTSEDDEPSYVTISEFGTGDIAIFQGGADPENDHWIMLAKKDMAMLKEIADRQGRR